MKVLRERRELSLWRELEQRPISLVPTMGNLHEGHLSLVQKALSLNKVCVISIFVNPLQFGKDEDLDKYPKTLEEDLLKLRNLENQSKKEIIVFAPLSSKQIFPEENRTYIEVKGLDNFLCGRFRPGHFIGVTTVVYQLFKLIKPQVAIFGQKDFQQVSIISKMTKDLDLPVEISMGAIVRNEQGLALSSRNQYLSDSDQEEALILNRTLKQCESLFNSGGLDKVHEFIERIKAEDQRFQYLDILDATNLDTPSHNSKKLVVAGAFILGDTRLIDNCLI